MLGLSERIKGAAACLQPRFLFQFHCLDNQSIIHPHPASSIQQPASSIHPPRLRPPPSPNRTHADSRLSTVAEDSPPQPPAKPYRAISSHAVLSHASSGASLPSFAQGVAAGSQSMDTTYRDAILIHQP
jgi:hypothetical protein